MSALSFLAGVSCPVTTSGLIATLLFCWEWLGRPCPEAGDAGPAARRPCHPCFLPALVWAAMSKYSGLGGL